MVLAGSTGFCQQSLNFAFCACFSRTGFYSGSMILWIFAVCLMAVLGLIGYYQGAIRVAFSLVGLLLGALLAMPLAGLLKPVLPIVGLSHPILLSFVAPAVVYVLLLVIFKSAALVV